MARKPRYFPIKRVVGMIALAAINTISWVPTIQQPISEFAIKLFPQIPKDTNWLAIVSAILFLGFVIWTLGEQSNKLEGKDNKVQELEDQKPRITVEPLAYPDDEYALLRVTNNGEKGDFSVQITLLSELRNGIWIVFNELIHRYFGVWQSSNTNKIEILNGHSDNIRIAHLTLDDGQTLELLQYDLQLNCVSRKYWHKWVVSSEYTPQPEYRVRVNISSFPSLKGGSWIKDYLVTLNTIEPIEIKGKAPIGMRS